MMTSTFLPDAAPPLPPPLLEDWLPDVRPATTPRTTAMRAMTATSDSENFTRGDLRDISLSLRFSRRRVRLRERFLNAAASLGGATSLVKHLALSSRLLYGTRRSSHRTRDRDATHSRNVFQHEWRHRPPVRTPAHHARGRRRRRRQPRHRVAGAERRPEGRARSRRPRERRRRDARLPPRPERHEPAPSRPGLRERQPGLR